MAIKGVNVNGTTCQIDYESLANKPTIPSKVSDLVNDLGFVTSSGSSDPSAPQPAHTQADWEQNNNTGADYIKNRPFYEEIHYDTQLLTDVTVSKPTGDPSITSYTISGVTYHYSRILLVGSELYSSSTEEFIHSGLRYSISYGAYTAEGLLSQPGFPCTIGSDRYVGSAMLVTPSVIIMEVLQSTGAGYYQHDLVAFSSEQTDIPGLNVYEQSEYYLKTIDQKFLDLSGKQDALTFDTAPTQGSDNPVKSSGVYTALGGKQDKLTFDSSPRQNSDNPVKSGGIYTALTNKQDKLVFDDSPSSGSNNPITSKGVYTALASKQNTLVFDNTPRKNSDNPVTSTGIFYALNQIKNDLQNTIKALQTTISTMQYEISELKRRMFALENGSEGDGTDIGFYDNILDLSGDGIAFADGNVDLNSPRVSYSDGVVDITTGTGGGTEIGVETSMDGTVSLSGVGVAMDNGTLDIRTGSFDNGVLDI